MTCATRSAFPPSRIFQIFLCKCGKFPLEASLSQRETVTIHTYHG